MRQNLNKLEIHRHINRHLALFRIGQVKTGQDWSRTRQEMTGNDRKQQETTGNDRKQQETIGNDRKR